MTQLRVASFFSGIGGFDLGLHRAGMKTVFLCEQNEFCLDILGKRFPDIELVGDIHAVSAEQIPQAEVWCGGFPCQDLSLANQGKRKGLEGARSGLFFAFANLIAQRHPDWIVLENVPGLLNAHSGADFQTAIKRLGELGYGVAWRVLDAKHFGTPQRRRRVYLVGSYGNLRSAEVLFEPGATEITPRAGDRKKQTLAERTGTSDSSATIYSIQHAGIGRKAAAGPQGKGYRNDGETYTLDSRGSADAICQTAHAFRVRDTTGLPARVDGSRYRTLGNAVAVPVIHWIGQRIIAVQNKYDQAMSRNVDKGEGV